LASYSKWLVFTTTFSSLICAQRILRLMVKLRRDWHRFHYCTFFFWFWFGTHMSYELASNLAWGANASILLVPLRPHVLSCPTIPRLNHQKRRIALPRAENMIAIQMPIFVTSRQVRSESLARPNRLSMQLLTISCISGPDHENGPS
jgi:hypothetical protein